MLSRDYFSPSYATHCWGGAPRPQVRFLPNNSNLDLTPIKQGAILQFSIDLWFYLNKPVNQLIAANFNLSGL